MALTSSLVTLLILPLIAKAATDTSTVTGTISSTITVVSPDTIEIPLSLGSNITNPQKVTVTANTNSWRLTVSDTSSDEKDGRLSKGETDLTDPLEIRGGDIGAYCILSSSQTLKNGGPGTTEISDIIFKQVVSVTATAGTYSITLTFTATPGS
jgi:hypothetical protein